MNHSIAKAVSRWGAVPTSSSPVIVRCGSTLKVLLLDKLDNYGAKGDVVDVKRGYARNFLIPRKKAVYATQEKLNVHKGIVSPNVKVFSVTPLAEEKNQTMRIRKHVKDETGKALSGIVTKFEIKTHFERQGIKIGVINIKVPIRTTGEHSIDIDGYPVKIAVEGFR